MSVAYFDLETRSYSDLKQVGGRVYAEHPTTELLTAVFSIDGVYYCWINSAIWPASVVIPPLVNPELLWPMIRCKPRPLKIHVAPTPPPEVVAACTTHTFVAHNCFGFDRFIMARLGLDAHFADSQPLASACGLPAGLDKLGELMLGRGKDEASKVLMRLCKPGKDDVLPMPKLGEMLLVARYNIDDVLLLEHVWSKVAISPTEATILIAHDTINQRGVAIDVELARRIAELSNEHIAKSVARIEELTGNILNAGNLRSIPQMTLWLTRHGIKLANLRRETVDRFLADPEDVLGEDVEMLDDCVAEVLRLRRAALRITGAKVEGALNRVAPDGRVRDLFVYHGAHTGRWTSRGIQVHNLPRPKKGVALQQLLAAPSLRYADLEAACSKGCTVDDALSALVRPMLVAAPGKKLIICDYAAIEPRCLAWLAGEESLLDAFRNDRDVYCEFGSKLFGRTITKKDDAERQIAKTTIIAAGYQQGKVGFARYCLHAGVDLAAVGLTAEACIEAYRSAYPAIAGAYSGVFNGQPYRRGGIWHKYEVAAKLAVNTLDPQQAGRCTFAMSEGDLLVTLPSARQLRYRNARFEMRPTIFSSEPKLTLCYDSTRGFPMEIYGGKWCWAGGTKILTRRGLLAICDVVKGDEVWDGVEWVHTDGAVYNGIREVGSWLGAQVTSDHLMIDGNSWKPAMHLTAVDTQRVLSWGRDSVLSLLQSRASAKTPSQEPSATAEESTSPTLAIYEKVELPDVGNVGIGLAGRHIRMPMVTQPSFPILPSWISGSIVIREWYRDALTRTTAPTRTTGAEESPSINRGLMIDENSSDTQRRCHNGMNADSTWTESTTTETTNPITYVWSREPSTRGTDVEVYDLLNCGPRHSYTVWTAEGPVVAHNCENIDQATCRDPLAAAMVECEAVGLPVVAHIHDELVVEVDEDRAEAALRQVAEIMSADLPWSTGFPIAVEGFTASRYVKSPMPGSYAATAKAGKIVDCHCVH